RCTVPTAGRASGGGINPAPAPTRAGARRAGRLAPAAGCQRPKPGPAPTPPRVSGPTTTGTRGPATARAAPAGARRSARTNNSTRTVRTDEGGAVMRRGSEGGRVGVGSEGNIYAGKDGNAYRRENGTWQKYENGGWQNTDRQPSGERPTPTGDRATTRQN